MASLAITFAAGSNAGDSLRQLASLIESAAQVVPSPNGSGASVTITFDNAPSVGFATFQVAGGGLPTQPTYRI